MSASEEPGQPQNGQESPGSRKMTRQEFLRHTRDAAIGAFATSGFADRIASWADFQIPERTPQVLETTNESTPTEPASVQEVFPSRKAVASPKENSLPEQPGPSPKEPPPGWTKKDWEGEIKRTQLREQSKKKIEPKRSEPRSTSLLTTSEIVQTETLDPVNIEGLETFGHEKPLTLDQYNQLVAQLNAEAEANPPEMDQHRWYSTVIVRKSEYTNIPDATGDGSFQEFVNRHTAVINQMLTKANADIPGNEEGEQILQGLTERRVIVVEDEVDIPYEPSQITDSDGLNGAWIERGFDPTQSYWDAATRTSMTWIHEAFHTAFHLPDEYRLKENFSFISPTLGSFPPEYQKYWLNYRRDGRENTIMNSLHLRLGPYAAWALARRVIRGENHQPADSFQETHGFPKEVPDVSVPVDLEKFPTAHHIRLGQVSESNIGFELRDQAIFILIENGKAQVESPFYSPYGKVLTTERCVGAIVIYDQQSNPLAFRLWDAPDILIGRPLDCRPEEPVRVSMNMQLVSFDNPIPWEEAYSQPIGYTASHHRIHLPLVQRMAKFLDRFTRRDKAPAV